MKDKICNITTGRKMVTLLLFLVISVGQFYAKTPYSDKLLKKANSGNAQAQYELGMALSEGNGVEKDYKAGVSWIEKSANQGYRDAQSMMGDICYFNNQEFAKAAQWWRLASDKGDLEAAFNLSLLYKWGSGVEKDLSRSVRYLKIAAEGGHSDAMYNLSNYYERGDGVAQDWSKCHFWRTKAADLGQSAACYNLAHDYLYGHPAVKPDKDKALGFMHKAEELGYPVAMLVLGEAYYQGGEYAGGKHDYAKAVGYLNKFLENSRSMEMDNEWMGTAYLILSKCYRFGRGVDADEYEADRLYRKAKAYEVTDEKMDRIIEELR